MASNLWESMWLQSTTPTCSPQEELNISRDSLSSHWRQSTTTEYSHHVIVGLIVSVIGAVALVGNTLTIAIIAKFPRMHTGVNILMVNLAISDLMLVVANCPLYVASSFRGYWYFSSRACELYGFFGATSGLLSINTLAAIAIERCSTIVRPKFLIWNNNVNRSCKMILFVWIYSTAWATPPFFGWNRYTWDGFGTTCSYDYRNKSMTYRSFIWSMLVGGFLLPLFVIIVCYTKIFVSVFRHKRRHWRMHSSQQSRASSPRFHAHRKRTDVKIAGTMLLCVILYCAAWTPYAIVSIIGITTDGAMITPLVAVIPGIFAKASTIYNPVLYVLCHPRINKLFCLMIRPVKASKNAYRLQNIPAVGSPCTQRKKTYLADFRCKRSVAETACHAKSTKVTFLKGRSKGVHIHICVPEKYYVH